MNKIILIGNGFDLAHGLKTSYKDFIDDFWEKEKEKVIAGLYENRDNFPIIFHEYKDEIIRLVSPCRIEHLPEPIDTNIKGYLWFKELSASTYTITINGRKTGIEFENKNIFLNIISEEAYSHNWVDIERLYYLALNECLTNKDEGWIEKLNNDFLVVQKALEKYLSIQIEKGIRLSETIYGKFNSLIYPTNIGETANYSIDTSIMFLNFNYTNIDRQYMDYFTPFYQNGIESIHIHGELNNQKNPIIFGYGDEIDDNYKLIENKNDNRYFENIKSFKYLETDNYNKMLSFITSDEYQVFIMGHSCGISDRTLLNTLFEHENCKSIQVFYHKKNDGTDNYSDVVRNISRNFTNKALMREKVVNKKDSKPLT